MNLELLGATQTMEGYLRFVDHIVARGNGAGVQPLFGLSGDHQLRGIGSKPRPAAWWAS